MQIVSIILMVVGICLFTGFSIIDFIKNNYEKGKEKIHSNKEVSKEESKEPDKHVIISNGNDDEEDNKHVKISSIDEITKIPVKENQSPVEEIKEEAKEERKPNRD